MMDKYLEMPWSIEDTIKNLKDVKRVLQHRVLAENLDGKGKQDAEEIAFDFDRAIEALEKQMWIPCSERLPEKNGDYLCCSSGMAIITCGFANDIYKVDEWDFCDYKGKSKKRGFYDYDSEYGYYEVDDVVAWMPLPEPYKGD